MVQWTMPLPIAWGGPDAYFDISAGRSDSFNRLYPLGQVRGDSRGKGTAGSVGVSRVLVRGLDSDELPRWPSEDIDYYLLFLVGLGDGAVSPERDMAAFDEHPLGSQFQSFPSERFHIIDALDLNRLLSASREKELSLGHVRRHNERLR